MDWYVEYILLFNNKQASLDYFCQCIICLLKIGEPLMNRQIACQMDLSGLIDFNSRGYCYRVDIV